MAKIIGTLLDLSGNALANTRVIARQESLDPAGDSGETYSDAIGSYSITVAVVATIYNMYVISEEGGDSGPNFSGKSISSGDAVSSFVLLNDNDFGIEHYINGEGETPGTHKQTTHDDITIRATGFVEWESNYAEFRIGDTARALRIEADTGNAMYWFNPYHGVGISNYDIGLRAGHDSDPALFYFGIAKSYWIKTDGSFSLNDGTIAGAVTAIDDWTLQGDWIFDNYPEIAVYVAPTTDKQFAPKKYVDDRIADFACTGINWRTSAQVLKMVDDGDSGGTPPTSPIAGDAYVVNNWGGAYVNDDIYEWDGSSWVYIVTIADETKVLVVDSGAGGSFAGKENNEAVYDIVSGVWVFTTPSDGWAIVIIGDGGYYEGNGYVYNTDNLLWNLTFGPLNIVAGDALTKTGNTLDVNVDDDTIEINGSNDLTTKLIKPKRVSQAGLPTPAVGELKMAYNTNDSKLYAIYNDVTAGVVSVELA